MPRQRKDHRPFSIKMSAPLLERLNDRCMKSGQSKTFVTEKALADYLDILDEREKEYDARKTAARGRADCPLYGCQNI